MPTCCVSNRYADSNFGASASGLNAYTYRCSTADANCDGDCRPGASRDTLANSDSHTCPNTDSNGHARAHPNA